MRYKQFIGLLVISTSLVSCTFFKASCKQCAMSNHIAADSVLIIYGDSIDSIIMDANKVYLYDMVDFAVFCDSIEKKDSLFGYKIKKNIGLLKKEERSILSFIVSDQIWYIKDYAPVRQPFHPNIVLEFICKKSKAFVLVSFGTEEVAISDVAGHFKFYKMRDKRLMARWAYMKFPEEEYYKELIKR